MHPPGRLAVHEGAEHPGAGRRAQRAAHPAQHGRLAQQVLRGAACGGRAPAAWRRAGAGRARRRRALPLTRQGRGCPRAVGEVPGAPGDLAVPFLALLARAPARLCVAEYPAARPLGPHTPPPPPRAPAQRTAPGPMPGARSGPAGGGSREPADSRAQIGRHRGTGLRSPAGARLSVEGRPGCGHRKPRPPAAASCRSGPRRRRGRRWRRGRRGGRAQRARPCRPLRLAPLLGRPQPRPAGRRQLRRRLARRCRAAGRRAAPRAGGRPGWAAAEIFRSMPKAGRAERCPPRSLRGGKASRAVPTARAAAQRGAQKKAAL